MLLELQDATAAASAERQPLDLYATDPKVALAICEDLAADIGRPGLIIEPSAGPGRFVSAARLVWPGVDVVAVDVDGAHRRACLDAGAMAFIESDWPAYAALCPAPTAPRRGGPLLILGNPPFSQAVPHITAALGMLEPGEHLVFLLRQSIRGSKDRVGFWSRSPLEEAALVIPRPSFIGGNDSSEYEALRWTKGHRGRATIAPPILWGSALAEQVAVARQLELGAVTMGEG